ncbi:MAG: uroporphyrinogen-III C-methyltransferase, partial [Candidatus Omnitrophica bacterium]|nr:uroporphyrinogen-III C-methyltransferase [Candidatus Omnitrophota bacterium]
MKKSKYKQYKVYFVGSGPAGFDLITVRGVKALASADTVIYDYLSTRALPRYLKEEIELICAGKLAKKGKYSQGSKPEQDKINKLIIKKVREGKKIVRLKNGSLALFSRISEELDALEAEDIDFELIPGVTAAEAAASALGISLTERTMSSSSIFVTGHQTEANKRNFIDWSVLAKVSTIVLYMGVKNLKQVTTKIIKNGRDKDTSVIAIQDIASPNQKIIVSSLDKIDQEAREKKLKPPAIIIIGEVCDLYKRFNQNNKKKILFTGLSKKRFFLKDNFYHLPLIEIRPLNNYKKFDSYLCNIKKFDWLVFTSRYGVKYFWQRLKKVKKDARDLSGLKIAAIGGSTKNKLQQFGIVADLVPKIESSAGLIKAFERLDIKGKKIFLPRSDIS